MSILIHSLLAGSSSTGVEKRRRGLLKQAFITTFTGLFDEASYGLMSVEKCGVAL